MPAILPPCKLIEIDLSGVEAVILGWYAARLTDDPMVIRFGKLGLHALVASHLVHKPPDMAWPDDQLAAYFKQIKTAHPDDYEPAKRTVHGTGYGMTPEGMVLMFPQYYPDLKYAQFVQGVYFSVCKPVPAFQLWVKSQMARTNYLGGPVKSGLDILSDHNAHPYTYDHHFWNAVDYRKLSPAQCRLYKVDPKRFGQVIDIEGELHALKWGPDSKRGLAFYPQSTAGAKLKEDEIELFDEPDGPTYVGDFYYGRTPLRAPIHDSLLAEVPFRKVDQFLERALTALLRPVEELPLRPGWNMGSYLTIGVEGKIGDDWEAMHPISVPTLEALGLSIWDQGVAGDQVYIPAEEADDEDSIELRTPISGTAA